MVCMRAQSPPIPSSPPGYLFMGARDSQLVLEVFYDNLCYGSAMNWPVFSQAISKFSNRSLGVIIHIFPLPYHRNSFLAAWAGETILKASPSKFPVFMSYIFQYYKEFISQSVNLTELEVMDKYAAYAEKYVEIDYDIIMEGYQNLYNNLNARYAWKYACSRGVSGTPTFFANGVVVPNASEFSYYNWSNFIQKFIQASGNMI
ncbi:hypothetical protein LOD99_13049 [Oopsacas minuta]|uniref:Thioredoxin-like fold domain-containing protein n=1 Tax=Oopsacas minuta TaxID=111878 RepID=A0AAV7JAT8_9METZ|nr:hypothetical protein LOD99_13049 [Oopsacas minuta]